MCGRFTLKTRPRTLAEAFQLDEEPPWQPRYNIAPTQNVGVVRQNAAGKREAVALRWGLIPSWADDPSIGNRMINARSETVAEKAAFRTALRRRRCLVPADGFYEWAKVPGGKQPYYFQMREGIPFAIAGLWEEWKKGAEPIQSFTLLTTSANDLVAPLHDRMPVIIASTDYDLWLDPKVEAPQELQRLLGPFPSDAMTAIAVGRWVNAPTHDDPQCIEPAG
jgi:putative SOS response-associated peptidase YedK